MENVNNTNIDQNEEGVITDLRSIAFRGEYPLDVILEGIEKQFNDYINIEDKNDYMDIFYDQLEASREDVLDEVNADLLLEALDKVYDQTISFIYDLFHRRFTISISTIESEEYNKDEIEFIFRKLYNSLVLKARDNFKKVISQDIHSTINTKNLSDEEYFKKIEDKLIEYSPLILDIGPMEFIRYMEDEELLELFNSTKVNGNFLRKYSPKLYQNEDLKVEIINEITLLEGENL